MTLMALALVGLALALLPAALVAMNVKLFRRLPNSRSSRTAVSVLIPARNEEASIVAAVESVLANDGATFEVIVLDDQSDDATPTLVTNLAKRDPRVKLAYAPPLPVGWCGKQFACQTLSGLALNDLLIWMDADVRLAPDALARIAAWMDEHPSVGLLSGFPHQETGTFLEKLLIPLIHFVLLGFLPLAKMRASTEPAFGAGCGQLFAARRASYRRAGGHAAIRSSLHDGIMLPRAFRAAGIPTDLFDATDLASCRMYSSFGTTWFGLAKNATEGMASPRAIVWWTLLLLGGQVMPLALLITAIVQPSAAHRVLIVIVSAMALCLSAAVRFTAATIYRQPRPYTLLQPLAIVALLLVQWYALLRSQLGKPATWKGRGYVPAAS